MKKEKLKKYRRWTKAQIARFITVFILNVLLMGGILVGSIFLNGIGFNAVKPDFVEYFTTMSGQFIYLMIILVLIMAVTFVYLIFENREKIGTVKDVEMIFLIIELTLLCNYFAGRYINIYFRPLALGGLLTLLLVNRRSAVFVAIVTALLTFLMDVFTNANYAATVSANAQYSSLVIGFSTGIISVYLIDGIGARIKVFGRGVTTCLPVLICLVLLEQTNLLSHWERIVAGASSGILSVVLFMAILPLFEWLFKKLTNYRLAELTEHSAPLIRRMIEEAPGTFNHSIVVSNLAESCATAIGENALLARCAAYYHDMGKLRQPEFFKENQQDSRNPHNDITPELSANIVRAHAKDGYEIVKRYGLPLEIADMCLQHHGTMPMMYFYAKAKQFKDGGDVDVEKYCYTGPKPQTKIAAILMIADAGEAAVRSLKDRSREKVDALIEKLINERMQLRQFEDCDITMKELTIIRNTITNNLTGVYHSRIEYPKVNLEEIKTEESE